jgi:hypothetical protein
MTKAVTTNRWFSGWRADGRPAEVDPADFGTAFGLDLSLNELQHEAAAAPPSPSRRPGWVQRLADRRKPAI